MNAVSPFEHAKVGSSHQETHPFSKRRPQEETAQYRSKVCNYHAEPDQTSRLLHDQYESERRSSGYTEELFR